MARKLLVLDPLQVDVSDNVRGDVSEQDAQRMAADLLDAGCQLQPVGVRSEGRRWKLVYGHRRLAGLLWLLQHADLPAESPLRSLLAIEVQSGEEDRLLQVRENAARRNLSPIEQASIIEDLIRDGFTVERVAQVFGRSPGWVSQRRALLSLPDEIRKEVGVRISPYHAYLMAQMPKQEMVQTARDLLSGPQGSSPRKKAGSKMRRRPTSRDAVRILRQYCRRFPGAEELLVALIDYLDGKYNETTLKERLNQLPGRAR